jgi:signal transduction histidine kinase/DNA-binding response OmpR family regulator
VQRHLTLLALALAFYSAAGVQWWTQFSGIKAEAERTVEEQAATAASLINADAYQALLRKGKIPKGEYEALSKGLVAFHKNNPDIVHLYTISRVGKNKDVYSIFDTDPSGQIKKIPEPDGGMLAALEGEKSVWTDAPNRNEQGADTAIYIPLKSSDGTTVGALAMTKSQAGLTQDYTEATTNLLINVGLYTIALLLVWGSGRMQAKGTEKAEAQFRRTEDRLKTMTERIPGAVFIFLTHGSGEKGQLLLLSKGAEALLNTSTTEAQASWKEITGMLPPEMREAEKTKLKAAKAANVAWECEFLNKTTNRWIQIKATAKKDEGGNTAWFGTIMDITLQKRETVELGETNEILKQISQAPDDPATLNKICEFGASEGRSTILHFCEGEKIYGIAGAEISQKCGEALAAPRRRGESGGAAGAASDLRKRLLIGSITDSPFYNDAEELRGVLQEEGYKSSICIPLVSVEQECFGVFEVLSKEFIMEDEEDAKAEQAAHLAQAALEREKNRRTLEENERRYRILFETSPIGICEANDEGQIIYSNSAFQEMVDEQGIDALSGHQSKEGRKEIKQKNRALLAETTKIEKANGRVHLITFLSNITEQKEKEEKAITSKEMAEAANKAKSEFLAVMSHEIRTPLNGVIGFSQILEGMELGEKQKSFVGKIRQSGETLLSTINDILSLSKIEAGKIDLEMRPFDLRRTIETAAELLSPKANDKGVAIEVDCESLPPSIVGDETRVRQIILNLGGNAVKFTDKGEVSIKATYKDQKVTVRVRDTGIGISKENQKKLFQPFSQADTSTTRKYGGTGLGLVICRKLAELMGGSIKLESEEEKGSTFTVVFPAKASGALEEKPNVVTEEKDLLPLNILVAEDDEVNRIVIAEMLKGFGHEIEFAKNGREAVEKAKELHDWADLILMDMRMPEMDGMEATRTIREWEGAEKKHALAIFALTANAMEEDRQKCLAAGMNNYISKPIDVGVLKKALAQCQKAKRKTAGTPTAPIITPAEKKAEPAKARESKAGEPPEKEKSSAPAALKEKGDKKADADEDTTSEGDPDGLDTEPKPKEDTDADPETGAAPEVDTDPDPNADAGADAGAGAEEDEKPAKKTESQAEPKAPKPAEDEAPESSEDVMFGEWGFGEEPLLEVNEENNAEEGGEIVNLHTLNACLEIIPIERVESIILPSMTTNCRKGCEVILSADASPEAKSSWAHKMCGSLGTFGCVALEKVARSIESHYKMDSGPAEGEKDLQALVEKTLETLTAAVEKKLGNKQ